MNLREFIQSLARHPRPVPKLKVYQSFDQALSDSHTYEDPGIIEIVSRKTADLREMLGATSVKRVDSHQMVQNMFVLSYVFQDRELDVLELGGACGAGFFELNKLLPGRIRRWHIVETPSMAAIGRDHFQEDTLAFYDDLDAAVSGLRSLDLLIAQGVLQYLREPFLQLGDLLNLGFEYVYVTRTLVANDRGEPIITKQVVDLSAHGPGMAPKGFVDRKTSQPLTILPFESLRDRFRGGHNILFSFVEGEEMDMQLESGVLKTRNVGFLLKRA